MKYKLDCKENFKDSLLFWIARFVKYKLTTLSNKELREPAVLASINYELTKGVKTQNFINFFKWRKISINTS